MESTQGFNIHGDMKVTREGLSKDQDLQPNPECYDEAKI